MSNQELAARIIELIGGNSNNLLTGTLLQHYVLYYPENSPNGAPVSARVLWHENLNVHRKGNIRSS